MRKTVITAVLCAPLIALAEPLAAVAAPAATAPQRLTASQLDSVTAGAQVSELAAVASAGSQFAVMPAAAGTTVQSSPSCALNQPGFANMHFGPESNAPLPQLFTTW